MAVLSITPGDVSAVGNPLIRVRGEAPWVIFPIGITAVVLPQVSVTHTQTTIEMMEPIGRGFDTLSFYFCFRRSSLWPPLQDTRTRRYSLASEVLWQEGVVMGELRIPALTCHSLWSHIHRATVICARPLETGCCYIDICVLAGVGFWQKKKKKKKTEKLTLSV